MLHANTLATEDLNNTLDSEILLISAENHVVVCKYVVLCQSKKETIYESKTIIIGVAREHAKMRDADCFSAKIMGNFSNVDLFSLAPPTVFKQFRTEGVYDIL